MRRQDRLRPLEVGVAGQDHVEVAVAPADKRPLESRQLLLHAIDRPADPKAEVGRDLIVAAAGGMEFASRIAQPLDQRPLDVHVNVFELDPEGELPLLNFPANVRQGLLNLKAFVRREQPPGGEHLGVGDRGCDILGVEPPIEAHAFRELLDAAVRRLIEDPTPCLFSHGILSAR